MITIETTPPPTKSERELLVSIRDAAIALGLIPVSLLATLFAGGSPVGPRDFLPPACASAILITVACVCYFTSRLWTYPVVTMLIVGAACALIAFAFSFPVYQGRDNMGGGFLIMAHGMLAIPMWLYLIFQALANINKLIKASSAGSLL